MKALKVKDKMTFVSKVGEPAHFAQYLWVGPCPSLKTIYSYTPAKNNDVTSDKKHMSKSTLILC